MDIEYITSLTKLFDSSNLTELTVKDGDKELTLKREKESVALGTPMLVPASQPSGDSPRQPETSPASDTIMIPSPIVGTFYRTPAPDAPPFIEVGDTVKPGDALCIIEAMKMMNRLEAEFACEIVAIHAEHGKLVEYGADLIEVRKV